MSGKRHVAVLMGGPSSEREVSFETGRACAAALERKGFAVTPLDAGPDLAHRLTELRPDVAFVALHGTWGEDGCVQGLLEWLRIPYTGSGVAASAVAMDKELAKRLLGPAGVPVLPHLLVRAGEPWDLAGAGLDLPVVVKPNAEGSSVGVTIVRHEADLPKAVAAALACDRKVLVEPYVEAREVQAAWLAGRSLGAIEVVPAGEFYDFAAKYQRDDTGYLYPAPVAPEVYARCLALADTASRALECRGATRCDLLVAQGGEVWFLEINTLPGMTSHSLLPQIAEAEGIGFDDLCVRLVEAAGLDHDREAV